MLSKKIIINQVVKTSYQIGTGEVACLFIGPTSIYLPTIPVSLHDQLTFYGVDDYWTIVDPPDQQHVKSLTMKQILSDLFDYQQCLGFDKMLIMAPSAVGLIALAYAKQYPERVLGVVAIGSPLTMRNLAKHSQRFFKQYDPENWQPILKKGSLLAEPVIPNKWQSLLLRQTEYSMKCQQGFERDIDDYIAELKRDEDKYYYQRSVVEPMYERWKTFNITMRKRFFELIVEYDVSELKKLQTPILFMLGLYDGIVPPYLVCDRFNDFEFNNFEYFICQEAAHMPQLEEPHIFANVVGNWITRQFSLVNSLSKVLF